MRLPLIDAEKVPERVLEGVTLAERDGEGKREGDEETLADSVLLAVPLRVREKETDGDLETVGKKDGDAARDALTLGERETLAVREGDAVSDLVLLAERLDDAGSEIDGETLAVRVLLTVALLVTVVVTVEERVTLGERDRDASLEGLTLGEREELAAREGDIVGDAVTERDDELLARETLTEGLRLRDEVIEGEREELAKSEGDLVGDAVPERDGELLSRETLTEGLRLRDKVVDGERDADGDTLQLREPLGVKDCGHTQVATRANRHTRRSINEGSMDQSLGGAKRKSS